MKEQLMAESESGSVRSFKSYISQLNFVSPLPLPQNKEEIPSNTEIEQSYNQIQESFPDVQTDQLVQVLYQSFITPKLHQKQGLKQCQLLTLKQQENVQKYKGGQNESNLKKAQQWKGQNDKEYHLKSTITNQSQKQSKISQKDIKIAAKAFCDRGYSIKNLKQEYWQNHQMVFKIDRKRYIQTSTIFIVGSYRRLQNFLIEECQKNIKPLIQPQIKALVPILLRADLKMDQKDYLTFRKFIRVTFDLGSVSIFENQAIKVYIKIQQLLRGKIGKKHLDKYYKPQNQSKIINLRSPGRFLNQRLEGETIWTKQLQFQLIDLMLQLKTLAKSREQFRKRYGMNATLNSCTKLKSRFLKIIRLSARRLQKIYEKHASELPKLTPFDDEKVKVLIRHHTARNARWALARLYKCDDFNQKLTEEAIQEVNKFCLVEQQRQIQLARQKKQLPIGSAVDKIKHNINMSRKLLHKVIAPAEYVQKNQDLVFLKESQTSYQHIVSLEHKDKLHYFRKTGQLNKKGGFQYDDKTPQLRRLEYEDGDDDSEQLVYVSDEDCESVVQKQHDI